MRMEAKRPKWRRFESGGPHQAREGQSYSPTRKSAARSSFHPGGPCQGLFLSGFWQSYGNIRGLFFTGWDEKKKGVW